ncbi:MAG: hypothetical protein B7733_18290 [Myxococcales bacterium FL481]|nr:MAG: hypothetical protein B7733_18290 [Myxococcales bacterium FL481]
MSLLANIDHLAAANGIEAVNVVTTAGSREARGSQSWHELLSGSIHLFQMTAESSIRLVVGSHTVVVQRENEETVAVVLPTGHAIAKSLRRMIRRMAKKDRGPLRPQPPAAPQPVVQHHSPPVPAPAHGPGPGPAPAAPEVNQPTPPDPTRMGGLPGNYNF